MNKELLKEMREAALELPVLNYSVKEKHEYTGKDLLLTGTKEVDGEPINPHQIYIMKVPAYYPINHFRRMKKIYKEVSKQMGHDEGYQAIMDYCTQVIYLKKKQDED